MQAVDASRCTEIVNDVVPNQLKGLNIFDFHPSFDIFFKDFIDNPPHISTFIRKIVDFDGTWKSAFQNIVVQFYFGVGIDIPPIKFLHVLVFVKCQRKHFEFQIPAG